MRPVALTVLLAAAFTLVAITAPARAHEAHMAVPGQREVDEPVLNLMRDSAVTFHAERGAAGCESGIGVAVAPGLVELGHAYSDHAFPRCLLVLQDSHVSRGLAAIGQTRASLSRFYVKRERIRSLCRTVFHEVGHAVGLALPQWDGSRWVDTHPETGLMRASGGAVPGECQAFARHLVWRSRSR